MSTFPKCREINREGGSRVEIMKLGVVMIYFYNCTYFLNIPLACSETTERQNDKRYVLKEQSGW